MNRSAPILSRAATSSGPGWLTPIHTFWWKYSVASFGEDVVLAVTDLAGGARVADAADDVVEPVEQRRHPRAALLGQHDLEAGEALEDARQDHVDERALAVERRPR